MSNKMTKLANTGYFQLKVTPAAGKMERIAFPGGQTETWLKVPEGDYKLQLEYIKNPSGELHDVVSKTIGIKVGGR